MSDLIVFVTLGGVVIWVVTLFYKDAKIENNGVVLAAKIINMSAVSANDNGSSNIRYKLLVEFPEGPRLVEGKDTISTFYSSQLEPGKTIKIKYLDDNNLRFIFRE